MVFSPSFLIMSLSQVLLYFSLAEAAGFINIAETMPVLKQPKRAGQIEFIQLIQKRVFD